MNPSIATVDRSTGAVTGVSPGTVEIDYRYGTTTYYYYITVLDVPNGTYFLKNKQTGLFADIDGPTMANNQTIHQWGFHGYGSQKWVITHIGGGYYSLHTDYTGEPYYLGVRNDSTAQDADIVLRYGSLTSGMKWKIQKTASGAYKLIPKTGEANGLVLATSTSDATNGAKLIQELYVDNNSYRDEWEITRNMVQLCGISSAGHDHESYLEVIGNHLSKRHYSRVNLVTGTISGEECKNFLQGSNNIFISRSHGQIINNTTTGIVLDETEGIVGFYGKTWNGMSSNSSGITNSDSFSNLELVVFIGCSTGFGGENADNLVTAIHAHGARTAIGFKESIDCEDANTWLLDFYNALNAGKSVYDAASDASLNQSQNSTLRFENVLLVGNSNYKLR